MINDYSPSVNMEEISRTWTNNICSFRKPFKITNTNTINFRRSRTSVVFFESWSTYLIDRDLQAKRELRIWLSISLRNRVVDFSIRWYCYPFTSGFACSCGLYFTYLMLGQTSRWSRKFSSMYLATHRYGTTKTLAVNVFVCMNQFCSRVRQLYHSISIW